MSPDEPETYAEAMAAAEPVTPGWEFVSIGLEGDAVDLGGGINPWEHGWTPLREVAVVAHPSYPWQRHDLPAHQLAEVEPPLTFAAGEVSASVWCFYVAKPS